MLTHEVTSQPREDAQPSHSQQVTAKDGGEPYPEEEGLGDDRAIGRCICDRFLQYLKTWGL